MINFVALFSTAAAVLGTSSDVGSNLQEPTASRLAQLEDASAIEMANLEGSAETYNVSEIKDGMLVFIYNIEHRYSKLTCQEGIFDNNDVSTGQLWRLKEDETRKGYFFLVNWASSDGSNTNRLAFNGDKFTTACFDGPKYDDQLWKFVKTTDGYWKIYNAGWFDGKCGLALWSDNAGGVWCPSDSGVSFDATWEIPAWEWALRSMWSVWTFRVKPAFDSDALWAIADSWDNRADEPLDYTFTYFEGITQSIEQTIAKSQSTEHSLSLGIEAAIEGIGLSASETMTVMQSFSESYSKMESKTWSVKREVKINVPAHTKICIKQLKVNTYQNLMNRAGFTFSSRSYRVDQDENC